MNNEMIDWIEYNIEHDPESVDLMLSRLSYSSLEDLEEAMDIIKECSSYKDKLKNWSSALCMVSREALRLIQDIRMQMDFPNDTKLH